MSEGRTVWRIRLPTRGGGRVGRRVLPGLVAAAVVVSGCAGGSPGEPAARPSPSGTEAAETPFREPRQLVSAKGTLKGRPEPVADPAVLHGADGDTYPEATLATLLSTGPGMPRATLLEKFAPFDDLRGDEIDRRRTITFSENNVAGEFYIDNKLFAPDRIDVRARLNTTEEWTVRNVSNEEHTFHIHVNDFQLMSVNGRPNDAHNWQDTVQLPVRGEVVIRMRFRDFLGKYPFHCHILNHEDRGMMANIEVVP